MNERSRAANVGSSARCATDWAKPLTMFGLLALEHVEHVRGRGRVGAHQRARRRRACRAARTRSRRSRRTASWRTASRRRRSAGSALRLSRWRISAPWVWITPFGSLVEPDVCTMTMRSEGCTSASAAREHGLVDRPSASSGDDAVQPENSGIAPRTGGHRRGAQRPIERRGHRGRVGDCRVQRAGVVVGAVRRRAQQHLDVGVLQQRAQLGAVENVLNGIVTAPMRAAASQPTRRSRRRSGARARRGCPCPRRSASRPRASAADCRSASA